MAVDKFRYPLHRFTKETNLTTQPAGEKYIVDGKGKPTAVILDIERYRKILALVQERLDRKESKFLPQSEQFRKLVQKGLKEIKEDKTSSWKEVWDEL